MRHLNAEEVRDVARGAAVLGTGGGGDPYLGTLAALRALDRYGRPQVVDVAATDRAARFGCRDHNSIDRRSSPGQAAEVSRPASKLLLRHGPHVAGLEELIRPGVPVRPTAETLHQHDTGHKRRPQPFALEDGDQGGRLSRALGEHAHAAAVQDEHGLGSARLLGVVLPDPPGNRLGPGQLGRRWIADLGHELSQVRVGLLQKLLTAELGAHGLLKQLGGGETSLLHLPVKVIGEVDLDPRHAPNHTPTGRANQTLTTGPDIGAATGLPKRLPAPWRLTRRRRENVSTGYCCSLL